jgi:hypothetical protein
MFYTYNPIKINISAIKPKNINVFNPIKLLIISFFIFKLNNYKNKFKTSSLKLQIHSIVLHQTNIMVYKKNTDFRIVHLIPFC